MRRACHFSAAVAAAVCLTATSLLLPSTAMAQQAAGVNPGRDCQTVRTCNFSRTGAIRGCLSSYTCRTCRTVITRCNIAGRTQCREFVCTWGG